MDKKINDMKKGFGELWIETAGAYKMLYDQFVSQVTQEANIDTSIQFKNSILTRPPEALKKTDLIQNRVFERAM
ncbi:hypothetical protein HOH87_07650 [bacterium]|nr:hypothetical protein [bacterium]